MLLLLPQALLAGVRLHQGLVKLLPVLLARCPHLMLLAGEPGSLAALLLPHGSKLHMQRKGPHHTKSLEFYVLMTLVFVPSASKSEGTENMRRPIQPLCMPGELTSTNNWPTQK